jgi:hypothetical protein
MDLEEKTIEELPERCESCRATLTQAEKQRILDEGATAALCTTCAMEIAPVADEEDREAGF